MVSKSNLRLQSVKNDHMTHLRKQATPELIYNDLEGLRWRCPLARHHQGFDRSGALVPSAGATKFFGLFADPKLLQSHDCRRGPGVAVFCADLLTV
jgi:hypothetical protein